MFHLPLIDDNKSTLQSLSTKESNKEIMAFSRLVVVGIFSKFVVYGEKGEKGWKFAVCSEKGRGVRELTSETFASYDCHMPLTSIK